MMRSVLVFCAGLLFAIGLGVSGMTDANKVVNFLNVLGSWDPTLLFVLGGAVVFHTIAYRLIRRSVAPWYASMFSVPSRKDIDKNLVVGSILFGIGWGISGFCPGPAFVTLVSGTPEIVVFVLTALAGMAIYKFLFVIRNPSNSS